MKKLMYAALVAAISIPSLILSAREKKKNDEPFYRRYLVPGSPLDGMDILEQIRSRSENVEVVMCTVDRNPRTAVRATKLGAYDYLTKDYEHLHADGVFSRRAAYCRED